MIGNKYLVKDLDDEFYDSIADIVNIINEHNYKNLFYKKDNLKSKKVFIGELLHEVLAYGTPKHRQRFKGLGEMDYDELWYTTMRPDSNCIVQVKANDMKELAKVFEVQVGSDPVKRRIFLENFKIYPEDIDN
jgi:DNA gyrase/topoisomerase IV subunit B